MIDIPLQPIANQELSIPLDNSRFVLRVKECNGGMCMTIVRDNEVIVQNARIVADNFVLQADYQRVGMGNFFFATQQEQLAYYDQFGLTQFMVYWTEEEVRTGVVN